jgi:hypothetical protein
VTDDQITADLPNYPSLSTIYRVSSIMDEFRAELKRQLGCIDSREELITDVERVANSTLVSICSLGNETRSYHDDLAVLYDCR